MTIPAQRADVLEVGPAVVLVEGGVLAPEVGHEQLGEAVAVHVLGVDAHAPLDLAGLVRGGAGRSADVLERAVPLVQEQEVGAAVVGDVEVGPAVAVEVGGDDAEPPAVAAEDAGRLGRVLERAVPRFRNR